MNSADDIFRDKAFTSEAAAAGNRLMEAVFASEGTKYEKAVISSGLAHSEHGLLTHDVHGSMQADWQQPFMEMLQTARGAEKLATATANQPDSELHRAAKAYRDMFARIENTAQVQNLVHEADRRLTGKQLQQWARDNPAQFERLDARESGITAKLKADFALMAKGEMPVDIEAFEKAQTFLPIAEKETFQKALAPLSNAPGMEHVVQKASGLKFDGIEPAKPSGFSKASAIPVAGDLPAMIDRAANGHDPVHGLSSGYELVREPSNRLALAWAAREVIDANGEITAKNLASVRSQIIERTAALVPPGDAIFVKEQAAAAIDKALEGSYQLTVQGIEAKKGPGADETLAFLKEKVAPLPPAQRFTAMANAAGELEKNAGSGASQTFTKAIQDSAATHPTTGLSSPSWDARTAGPVPTALAEDAHMPHGHENAPYAPKEGRFGGRWGGLFAGGIAGAVAIAGGSGIANASTAAAEGIGNATPGIRIAMASTPQEASLRAFGDAGMAFGGVGEIVTATGEELYRYGNDVATSFGYGNEKLDPGIVRSAAAFAAKGVTYAIDPGRSQREADEKQRADLQTERTRKQGEYYKNEADPNSIKCAVDPTAPETAGTSLDDQLKRYAASRAKPGSAASLKTAQIDTAVADVQPNPFARQSTTEGLLRRKLATPSA